MLSAMPLLPALLLALAPPISAEPALPSTAPTCDSVHLFLARGTYEPYPGLLIDIVGAVCNATGLAACGFENIRSPASFFTPEYCDSLAQGVANGTAQINAYAAACPQARLVLAGFSQGAHVLGNILGGQAGGAHGCTRLNNTGFPSRTEAPASRIAAAVLFGDPSHVANQAYNAGNGTAGVGLYERTGTQLERLNKYSDVLQSWCLIGDTFCAQGNDAGAHDEYFNLFSRAVGEWVAGKLSL